MEKSDKVKYFFSFIALVTLAILVTFGINYFNKSDLLKRLYPAESKSTDVVKLIKKDDEVTILNFGDAMFGRQVGVAMEKGFDPFESVRDSDLLKNADLVIANLEGPITDSAAKCQNKSYSFRFKPEISDLLALNKISLVNLSNNHSFDCYQKGLDDTRVTLDRAGVGYFGGGEKIASSSAERKIKGKKIAFVGINLTFNPKLDSAYLDLIKQLKIRNDFVIINIHWGTEYSKVAVSSQTTAGHKIIDAGADVIIGHHPHVIEPIEIYKGKPIFYSLGNFIFDQLEPENNEGVGVKIDLDKNDWPTFEILPYKIENMQPKLMDKNGAESFCSNFLKNYSEQRIGDCGIKI